jgi:hypothetical protein
MRRLLPALLQYLNEAMRESWELGVRRNISLAEGGSLPTNPRNRDRPLWETSPWIASSAMTPTFVMRYTSTMRQRRILVLELPNGSALEATDALVLAIIDLASGKVIAYFGTPHISARRLPRQWTWVPGLI